MGNYLVPKYIKCPCKDCKPPKRNAACHSSCEDYITYKSQLDIENQKVKEERRITQMVNEICVQGASCSRRPEALKRKKDK